MQTGKRKSGDRLPNDNMSSYAALFSSKTGKNYIINKTFKTSENDPKGK